MADELPVEEVPVEEETSEEPPAAPPAAPPAVPDEEPAVEEEVVEEAPVEEEPVVEEAPVEEEPVVEEPVVEEPAEDAKEEPEPEPVPEPVHVAEVTGDYDPESAWHEIAKDKKPQINWYTVELKKGLKMDFDKAGAGGLTEMRDYLVSQKAKVLFALLRVKSGDSSGSSRAKFVFVRFIGSGVGIMLKAKVGTVGTRADEMFPVKHLSLDLTDDEFLEKQTSMASLTKEFLRVGGAHKPEFFEYGPGQKHVF